ncbi:MAG: branched-chain amino acid ABC transporter permease [Burkholderiales bacterium]
MFDRVPRCASILIGAAIIAALPFIFTGNYWRGIMIVCALNVLLALGLNLVLGYCGQLNLGQSAFYGIGAYVSTILVMKAGWPFWPAFIVGVFASGGFGAILAIFGTRLRGHYLGIASLGFAVITYQLLINWIDMTEGPLGIYGIKPPPSISLPGMREIDFTNQANLFYLIGGTTFIVYLLLANLVRSPIGETLRAIREDEVSAASLGINPQKWKVFAFGIGAAIAGIAGGFLPPFVGTLSPDLFQIVESFTMMAMVIVGGMGTMAGPVIGAILLTVLVEVLRDFGELRLLVYGFALALVVLFMPGGIVQGWTALTRRRKGDSA